MLTKLPCALLLTTMAISAHAQSSDYFSGFYAGVGGFFQTNTESYEGPLVQRLMDASIKNIRGGGNSWGGKLFLGYGQLYQQRFYLGAEVYSHANEGKQDVISGFKPDRYLAIKAPYSYGITAKLGYLLNPQTLVYAGLGAEKTYFELKTNRNGRDIIILADASEGGFVPSVGADLALTQRWQVGTRISYVNYPTINFNNTGNISDSGSFNSRHTVVSLNLSYRFG